MLFIKTVLTVLLLVIAVAQVFLTINGKINEANRAGLTKTILGIAGALVVIDVFTGNSLQVVWVLLFGAIILTAIVLKAQRDKQLWDAVA